MESLAPRKSLGLRRVSFAEHAYVREFEKKDKGNVSLDSQEGDAASESDERPPTQVTDENAYPGAKPSRRRSSISRRRSSIVGEESMELDGEDTINGPEDWLRGPAVQDEDFSGDYYYDDDDLGENTMEMTEDLKRDILRRRSSVAGPSRPPLSEVPAIEGGSAAADQSHSFDDGNSQSLDQTASSGTASEVERSILGDYTWPLNKSLRPPEAPSEEWLALRAMTHSGDEPYEPQQESLDDDSFGNGVAQRAGDMELDDAMERLRRARESTGVSITDSMGDDSYDEPRVDQPMGDDSFTSSDDSFGDDMELTVERTVNLTGMMGKAAPRASTAISDMELTSVHGMDMDDSDYNITIPLRPAATAAPEELSSSENPPAIEPAHVPVANSRPAVFVPPTPSQAILPLAPKALSTPKPSATLPKPFSFAFTPKAASTPAPANSGRVSPSKLATISKGSNASPVKFSAAFAPPVAKPSPKKRAEIETATAEDSRPSPAKRQALAKRWEENAGAASPFTSVSPPHSDLKAPSALPVSKKAPFLAAVPAESAIPRPRSSLSQHLNRRRSVAVPATIPEQRKVAAGRASLGSEPTTTWPPQKPAGSEDSDEQEEERDDPLPPSTNHLQVPPTTSRQSSSPQPSTASRSSPPPAQLSAPSSPLPPAGRVPAERPRLSLRDELDNERGSIQDMDRGDLEATTQWRDNLEGQDFEEEEGVCHSRFWKRPGSHTYF